MGSSAARADVAIAAGVKHTALAIPVVASRTRCWNGRCLRGRTNFLARAIAFRDASARCWELCAFLRHPSRIKLLEDQRVEKTKVVCIKDRSPTNSFKLDNARVQTRVVDSELGTNKILLGFEFLTPMRKGDQNSAHIRAESKDPIGAGANVVGRRVTFGLKPETLGRLLRTFASIDGRVVRRVYFVQIDVFIFENTLPHRVREGGKVAGVKEVPLGSFEIFGELDDKLPSSTNDGVNACIVDDGREVVPRSLRALGRIGGPGRGGASTYPGLKVSEVGTT